MFHLIAMGTNGSKCWGERRERGASPHPVMGEVVCRRTAMEIIIEASRKTKSGI